jgi:4'-phosphopantetheinyl transferase EntD
VVPDARERGHRRDRFDRAAPEPVGSTSGHAGSGVIDEILPATVASSVSFGDVSEDELFPEEMLLIANAVPHRRAEFTTGRACARRALAELGVPPAAILSGVQREPLWPDGVVGSITHCAGFRAAAVGRAAQYRTIGIDAEPDEPLPDGILALVSLPVERSQLKHAVDVHLDRVLFSAKESVYKAWFPVARRWLAFDQAIIALKSDGTFDVRVLVPGPIDGMRGRWLVRERLVLTAVVAPHMT